MECIYSQRIFFRSLQNSILIEMINLCEGADDLNAKQSARHTVWATNSISIFFSRIYKYVLHRKHKESFTSWIYLIGFLVLFCKECCNFQWIINSIGSRKGDTNGKQTFYASQVSTSTWNGEKLQKHQNDECYMGCGWRGL